MIRFKNLHGVVPFTFVVALVACDPAFPPEVPPHHDDFGTEVFRLLHDEFLWSGTPSDGEARAIAFSAHREDVIWSLNTLTAGKVADGMLPVLERVLPLYDDRGPETPGLLPAMTRDLSGILADLAIDPPALEALAYLGTAPEANPGAVTHLLGSFARHPIAALDRLTALMLDLEPAFTDLFRWLAVKLPSLDEDVPVRANQETFFQRLLNASLDRTDEVLGPPVYSARLDARGALAVTRLPDGSLPAPFTDGDGDGLPDIDAAARLIDARGLLIDLPTFALTPKLGEQRDRLGRAIIDGSLAYDYFDLRSTVLAYLLRDTRSLLADDLQYHLFTALDALSGPKVNRSDADGRFEGFYAESAPVLDLVHALNEVRRYDRLVPLIRSLEAMATEQRPLLKQLIQDIAKIRVIFEDSPSLAAGNALFEDLHAPLATIIRAGGFRDLIAAAREPGTDAMFTTMARLIRSTGLSLPQDMNDLQTAEDVGLLRLVGDTPWDAPDTTDAQRSWLQKAAYLMADTQKAPVIMRLFDQVDVPEVQITADMAHLYVTAIANQAVLALDPPSLTQVAVDLAPEFDDVYLQAEELNLYMNHNQTMTGNPIGNRGEQVRNLYGPALLALQASGSLAALRPWVTHLVDRGLTDSFVDLFVVLAHHYSETAFTDRGFQSFGTGIRRLEPYLARALGDTPFGDHFLRLSAWMDTATFEVDGTTYQVADELDRFMRWLVDTRTPVRLRDGTTFIESKHGGQIQNPSRLQIVMDAFDRVDRALDANAPAREAWDAVDLLGVFLDLHEDGTFKNLHATELLLTLLPILADSAAQAVAEPTWNDDIDALVPDLQDIMTSRGFAALIELARRIRDNPAHKAVIDEVLAALLAEEPPAADADLMGATLAVMANIGQLRLPVDATTRLMRFLGKVVNPKARRFINSFEALRDIREYDSDHVTDDLARNLLAEPEVGRTPLGALTDAFKSALRPVPGAPSPYEAVDLQVVLRKMADWLRDEDKGMERLYRVIRSR